MNDAQFSLRRKMEVALKLTENASLRGMQNDDGMYYLSVYDFINFVTDHEPGHDYAYQTFKRLVKPGSEHANDILTNCQDVKFLTKEEYSFLSFLHAREERVRYFKPSKTSKTPRRCIC